MFNHFLSFSQNLKIFVNEKELINRLPLNIFECHLYRLLIVALLIVQTGQFFCYTMNFLTNMLNSCWINYYVGVMYRWRFMINYMNKNSQLYKRKSRNLDLRGLVHLEYLGWLWSDRLDDDRTGWDNNIWRIASVGTTAADNNR